MMDRSWAWTAGVLLAAVAVMTGRLDLAVMAHATQAGRSLPRPTPPPTARPAVEYQLRFDEPVELERRLSELGDQGFRCLGVPRPEAPLVPRVAGVVLGRPAGAAHARVLYRVLFHSLPASLAGAMNAAAADGFRLCGITAGRFERRLEYSRFDYVAVMVKAEGTLPSPAAPYRLLPSAGYAREWRDIEAAGRDGFAVTAAFWRPRPLDSVSDLVFLADRSSDAVQPLEFDLESGRDPVTLTDRLGKRVQDGFRIHAAWTAPDRLVLLLARPLGGRFASAVAYEVHQTAEEAEPAAQLRAGVFRVSSFASGQLLHWLPFGSGRIGVFDRAAARRQYEGVVLEVPSGSDRYGQPARVSERAQERLTGGYGQGRLLELLLRPGENGDRMRLETIVESDARP